MAACTKYLPELTALCNSLDYVKNDFDVHIIGLNQDRNKVGLPDEFTSQLNKLRYRVIHHPISNEEIEDSRGISEVACRKRYYYASQIGKDYKAVCVLDADIIFVRNPWQYFEIAEKTGFILGPCKEQNKVYDDEHHTFNKEYIIPKGFYNDKDLCNCPLFLDAALWGKALEDSWFWFYKNYPESHMKCPDMDCLNIALLHYNGHERIVKLPGLQWLGTNEQHLKPYIRVVERRGSIWTENGIEIFTYHGQYYKEKWRKCQLDNRHRCAAGYLKTTECPDNMAQGAMNLLYTYFLKMLDYKIVIPKKDYVK